MESQRNESIEGSGHPTLPLLDRRCPAFVDKDAACLVCIDVGCTGTGVACCSAASSRVRAGRTLVTGVFIDAVLLFAVVPRFASQRSQILALTPVFCGSVTFGTLSALLETAW